MCSTSMLVPGSVKAEDLSIVPLDWPAVSPLTVSIDGIVCLGREQVTGSPYFKRIGLGKLLTGATHQE